MNKIIPLLIIIFNSSFFIPPIDENEANIIKIAQNNLSVFLAKIPVGQENYFGFSNREEFNKCSIGKPYRVITFTNDFYNDVNLDAKNYLLIQNEWRVPVEINGENKLLLTVVKQDTTWNIVDIGGTGLAKELQQKSNDKLNITNYLLRIYPLSIDFLVEANYIDSFDNASYIPLASATMAIETLNNKNISKLNLTEVLDLIKQQLKQQPKN